MSSIIGSILNLSRPVKRFFAIFVDIFICITATFLAFYLRLGDWNFLSTDSQWRPFLVLFISWAAALPIFISSGLYRAIFRYSGLGALLAITKAVSIYTALFVLAFALFGVEGVPRTIGLIQPILIFLFVTGSRILVRFWLGRAYHDELRRGNLPRILIYGAGAAGRQLALALGNSYEMRVVGFLDDDARLHGSSLNGIMIYSPVDIEDTAALLRVTDIILAIPSASRKRRKEILERLANAKLSVRILPSFSDLASGKLSASDLRELDIDDLLGRVPVLPNSELMRANIFNKVVMVTGAGGSIGGELCRQIIVHEPSNLILVEQSEFALYSIQEELESYVSNTQSNCSVMPLLASVVDEDRMRNIFREQHVNTVFHAAAYKHVPLVESNPFEGIKNNIFGTLSMVRMAKEFSIDHFVLISTDKAVRPTNIMGATKRFAELILQAYDQRFGESSTIFSMVRFGNVLGSSGSVVPKFRQQIKGGGPVTLTDNEVTRYFMTIPEAAQLVIQASAMSVGGDVFVLDMGEPIKIRDLAESMIHLSGLTLRDENHPDGDIEIRVLGLRPGEKLYEELLIGNNPEKTSHERILRAHEDFIGLNDLMDKLAILECAVKQQSLQEAKAIFQEVVSGYAPTNQPDSDI